MTSQPTTSLLRVKGRVHGRRDKGEERLFDGYEPRPFDVICKRDRECIAHVGNNRFRLCVEMKVDTYLAARSRGEKTLIIEEIIAAVHSSGGRFIRQQRLLSDDENAVKSSAIPKLFGKEGNGERSIYFEIGKKKVADKVGHAMRLAISARERAKNSNSIDRRKSWPCPTASSSSLIFKDGNPARNFTMAAMPKLVSCKKLDIKSPRDVSVPPILSLPPLLHHSAFLTECACPNLCYSTNKGGDMSIHNCSLQSMWAESAIAMNRRQSWHAGYALPPYETRRPSEQTPTPWESVLIPSDDISLSSQEWDLSKFQSRLELDTDDAYTFASTLSLEEFTSAMFSQAPTEPGHSRDDLPRVVTVSPLLASHSGILRGNQLGNGDDDELSWDEFLFDHGEDL